MGAITQADVRWYPMGHRRRAVDRRSRPIEA